jgi:hypothetical protein
MWAQEHNGKNTLCEYLMLVTPGQSPGVLMSAIHAALTGSYRTSNAGVMVSNCAAHVSWTKYAACQWNEQAYVLSIMKARVARRRHAVFRPLAYAAHSMPRGSIGAPPQWGAGVYADRSGAHQSRSGHVSAPDPRLGLK